MLLTGYLSSAQKQFIADTNAKQAQLLSKQITQLSPSDPAQSDVYFFGYAPDAYDTVFLKEMTFVKDTVKSTFNAIGVSLINSSYVVNDTPMVTTKNLQTVLNAVGKKMSEDDVLLLFFTAHGGRSHYLSAWFEPFELKSLNGDAIKRMLDKAHIKRRVIVISACYSGDLSHHYNRPTA